MKTKQKRRNKVDEGKTHVKFIWQNTSTALKEYLWIRYVQQPNQKEMHSNSRCHFCYMFTVWYFEFKPEISHKNCKTVSGIESSQKNNSVT